MLLGRRGSIIWWAMFIVGRAPTKKLWTDRSNPLSQRPSKRVTNESWNFIIPIKNGGAIPYKNGGVTLPRTPTVPYIWRSTPQNKAFSNQNKGHLGSRYLQLAFIPVVGAHLVPLEMLRRSLTRPVHLRLRSIALCERCRGSHPRYKEMRLGNLCYV